MTKIQKLVMHGFKSFAKRTELLFGDDFNCILGPNGSGKSNVLDSLCFVLGRLSSKSLRAEKASNLIYNGGKTKKPMKQGEVSIFFDNNDKTFPTEDPFVKITRIIKQSGQSIYKINDQKRTRQQILDLMSVARIDPDGFNIVLQGDVVRFTEMNTEDRRKVVEDISGISVYEDKKQKALKELEKVSEKLREAEIILAERNAHLKELKKERDQAMKFKDLESKIKENKASYLYIQIQRIETEKKKYDDKISIEQQEINNLNENISQIKQLIHEKKSSIENINSEIEQKGEKDQVDMQREVEQSKVELATGKTRIEHCRTQIDSINLRKEQLKKDKDEIVKQIEGSEKKRQQLEKEKIRIQEDLKKVESHINKFKQDNSINDAADIEKQIDELDKRSEQKQIEIDELRKKQQELLRKKDSLEFQINTFDEKIEKIKEIEQEHKKELDDIKDKKQRFKQSILELNKRLNDDSRFAVEISEERQKQSKAQEKLAKIEAKQMQFKEQVAGNRAVSEILKQKQKMKGIYGTVSELGNVKSEYSLALEIAAGPRLNSLVVDSDKVASDCIKYLKQNKFGTATFLPLNKIKERGGANNIKRLEKANGVHGLAVKLVDYDAKFSKIFSYVFGDTLVVDNIDVARRLGIGSARMVTLEGDLTEISGAMQGGYRYKKNVGGFQEKDMISDLNQAAEYVESIENHINLLVKQREDNEKFIDKLREEKANLEGDIIKAEKGLHLQPGEIEASEKAKQDLQKQLESLDEHSQKIDDDISDINKELTGFKISRQQLRSKISDLRNPALLAELNTFEEKRSKLKEQMIQLDADIRNIHTEINDMKLPEKEKITELIKNHDKELENFEKEIKRLSEHIEKNESDLIKREKDLQEFHIKYKALFVKRDSLGDEIQKEENKIEKLREQSKEIEIRMNKFSLLLAEVKAKLAGLFEEFRHYEGVKINKEKSEDMLKDEIRKFEKMVNDIGNVNMRALEIYENIEKEYNSLLEKKDRLGTEKEDVMGMMDEIEGRKKELFMKTFDVINENFQRIFGELFTKGEASLVLENQENPFEAGLNIRVRLVGKKFLDIRGLSGGEKTLTALSFIFAIQEYDPHSFYVLDEVDAALDKHNSEKLAKLIRKYVDNAQYLVISHNDALISEADNLYGVSMNEHGITNVTSLKI